MLAVCQNAAMFPVDDPTSPPLIGPSTVVVVNDARHQLQPEFLQRTAPYFFDVDPITNQYKWAKVGDTERRFCWLNCCRCVALLVLHVLWIEGLCCRHFHIFFHSSCVGITRTKREMQKASKHFLLLYIALLLFARLTQFTAPSTEVFSGHE